MLTVAQLAAHVQVTGGSAASTELSRVGGAVSAASSGFGRLGGAANGLGGALSHAKGAISGLLTGPLGMIGLTGGLLGLGAVISGSISKVQDLGLNIEKLTGVTGESAGALSAELAVFDKYGISADKVTTLLGRLTKNVGTMTAQTKTAAQQQEGLTKAEQAVTLAELNLEKVRNGKKVTTAALTAAEFKLTDAETKLKDAQTALSSGTAAATKFQTEFGFSLYNTNGTVKDTNELILTAADYYTNKLIPGTEKAAALGKLFGKTWLDMVPVLALGSQGILDAEKAAASLGLTLTDQNAGSLADYQKNMRSLGEAVNGLQLQFGLVLIPVISDFAKTITAWLAGGGSQQLIKWFKDMVGFAQQVGHAIETVVVPAIRTIATAWDAIPGPIKTLILGAFVANKAVKWLFGIDVTTIAKAGIGLAASFLGNISGKLVANVVGDAASKAIPQDVFVVNWAMMSGGGGVGGAVESVVGAGEGAVAGGIGVAGGIAAALGGVVALALTGPIHNLQDALSSALGGKPLDYYTGPPGSSPFTNSVPAESIPGAPPVTIGENSDLGASTTAAINSMEALRGEHANMLATDQQLENATGGFTAVLMKATGWAGTWSKSLQDLEKRADKAFVGGTKDKSLAKDAGTITSYWLSLSSSYFSRNMDAGKNLQTTIDRLKADSVAATKEGNTTLAGLLNKDVTQLQDLQGKVADLKTPISAIAPAVSSGLSAVGTTGAKTLDVQRAILAKRYQAIVDVRVTPSVANLNVDGRKLANALITYFPHGTQRVGLS